MSPASIDQKNRSRFDPMYRATNYTRLPVGQLGHRASLEKRIMAMERRLLNPSVSPGSSGTVIVEGMPDPEVSGYGKVFVKKNDTALDTLNVALTDENNQPIIVSLNILASGELRPVAKIADFPEVTNQNTIWIDETNNFAYIGSGYTGRVVKINMETNVVAQTFVEPLGAYSGKVGEIGRAHV